MAKVISCLLRRDAHDHLIYKIELDELNRLVKALGYEVAAKVVQTRPDPDNAYLFGRGKVGELAELAERYGVDKIFVYNVLTSKQKLNLIRRTGVDVLDRYELTLKIFEENAADSLSKLQIELAMLGKLFPYYKLQASIALKTERPFFRGMGEYAYHNKITQLRRRVAKIKRQIKKLKSQKVQRIRDRRDLGFKTVCISGYYNAGKTSLFNVLTGSRKPVSDQPFTTLSSKYQRRYFRGSSILFVDTIGFVIGLDPKLIESFELNLEDLKSSDLVLFLVDVSDPIDALSLKLRSGLDFLRSVGVRKDNTIVVLNKLDLVDHDELVETSSQLDPILKGYGWTWISSGERMRIPTLLKTIAKRLRGSRSN